MTNIRKVGLLNMKSHISNRFLQLQHIPVIKKWCLTSRPPLLVPELSTVNFHSLPSTKLLHLLIAKAENIFYSPYAEHSISNYRTSRNNYEIQNQFKHP